VSCSRDTDGAGSYNSVFVGLFTLQLTEQTGIKARDVVRAVVRMAAAVIRARERVACQG
jgi:hypothetical protein